MVSSLQTESEEVINQSLGSLFFSDYDFNDPEMQKLEYQTHIESDSRKAGVSMRTKNCSTFGHCFFTTHAWPENRFYSLKI